MNPPVKIIRNNKKEGKKIARGKTTTVARNTSMIRMTIIMTMKTEMKMMTRNRKVAPVGLQGHRKVEKNKIYVKPDIVLYLHNIFLCFFKKKQHF